MPETIPEASPPSQLRRDDPYMRVRAVLEQETVKANDAAILRSVLKWQIADCLFQRRDDCATADFDATANRILQIIEARGVQIRRGGGQ